MKIIAVIPAYNEEQTIVEVVKKVKQYVDEAVVMDDGSSDNTARLAREAGALVLRHIINRGQGAALKTGIDYALKRGANIIVNFDADGQHQAEDIKAVVDPILENRAEVVLGSRFLSKKSQIPFFRKIVLRGAKIFNYLFLGINFSDPQSGIRALSRFAAEEIDITQDGMAHCSEILAEIFKKKLKAVEVPVVVDYTEYSKSRGQSSWNAFKIASRLIFRKITK